MFAKAKRTKQYEIPELNNRICTVGLNTAFPDPFVSDLALNRYNDQTSLSYRPITAQVQVNIALALSGQHLGNNCRKIKLSWFLFNPRKFLLKVQENG